MGCASDIACPILVQSLFEGLERGGGYMKERVCALRSIFVDGAHSSGWTQERNKFLADYVYAGAGVYQDRESPFWVGEVCAPIAGEGRAGSAGRRWGG